MFMKKKMNPRANHSGARARCQLRGFLYKSSLSGFCSLRHPEGARLVSPTPPLASGPALRADHLRAAALRRLQPFLENGSKLALRLTEHPNALPTSWHLSLVNGEETRGRFNPR
jgi:hypothetical protein